MQILPDHDPFLHLSLDNSSSPPSLPLKDDPDPFSFDVPFDLSSKKIVQIKDPATEQDIEIHNVVRLLGIEGKKAIFAPIKGSTAEEIEQALAEDKLGRMEETPEGTPVFKFPEQQAKKLESLGITSVEVREPSGGVRTYTSFHFQTLSDRELNPSSVLRTMRIKTKFDEFATTS